MLVKIISNGVEVEADISEQDLKKLFPAPKQKTGWEKVEVDKDHYYIDEYGEVCVDYQSSPGDLGYNVDCARDKVANNFSIEELAKNIARAEALHRNILRRSIELCDKLDWEYSNQVKYCIWFDYEDKQIEYSSTYSNRDLGQVYFDTEEHAQQVAEEFKDELLWYYTEFKERMD